MFNRIVPALALFVVSPLIAEFLLGNIAVDAFWAIAFFAPLYGGGAVLVRELARRWNRGWPTIFLLAFAYSAIEEGLVTQSLFNPSYFGHPLLSYTPIPQLGMGAWWTIYVVMIHTIWSIAVPIAIVESCVPSRAETVWLGRFGLSVVGLIFLAGAVLNFYTTYQQEAFTALRMQLALTVLFVVLAAAIAFFVRKPMLSSSPGSPPSFRLVFFASFISTVVFSLGLYAPFWFTVAFWIAQLCMMACVVIRWSRRVGWQQLHILSLAAGAMLTYALQSFPHRPVMGSDGVIDLLGNLVFSTLAGGLIVFAYKRVRVHQQSDDALTGVHP